MSKRGLYTASGYIVSNKAWFEKQRKLQPNLESDNQSSTDSEAVQSTDTDDDISTDSDDESDFDSDSTDSDDESNESNVSSSYSNESNTSSTYSNNNTSQDSSTQTDAENDDKNEMDHDEKVNYEFYVRSRYYETQPARIYNKKEILVLSYCQYIFRIDMNMSIKLFRIIPKGVINIILNYNGKYFEMYHVAIGQCGTNIMANATNSSSTLFLDSDPAQYNIIRASNNCITETNSLFGSSQIHENNWADGYYGSGAEFGELCLNKFRHKMEQVDNSLEGIEFVHSIGGATGSGMGCFMMEKVKDIYENLFISTLTVFPSPHVSDVVVEPYNAVLSMEKFEYCTDQIFVMDNEQLFKIARGVFKKKTPTYSDLNLIANNAMNGVRSIWKYSGWNIVDVCNELKRGSQRRKYFCTSNIFSDKKLSHSFIEYNWYNVYKDKTCFSANIDGDYEGSILSTICSLHFRFPKMVNMDRLMYRILKCEARLSVDGIISKNSHLNPIFIDRKHEIDTNLVCMIANHTGIVNVFERLLKQYDRMCKRKAFFHWYKGVGMTDDCFVEARENLMSLIDEYSVC